MNCGQMLPRICSAIHRSIPKLGASHQSLSRSVECELGDALRACSAAAQCCITPLRDRFKGNSSRIAFIEFALT
jgi:hypothetical protein